MLKTPSAPAVVRLLLLLVVATMPVVSSLACAAGGPDPEPSASPEGEPSSSPEGEPAASPEPEAEPEPQPGDASLAYCAHAIEACGASYYDTAQDCYDAAVAYWGSCESRLNALDAFNTCMLDVPCDDYNPDSYNPSSTPCADEYAALGSSDGC